MRRTLLVALVLPVLMLSSLPLAALFWSKTATGVTRGLAQEEHVYYGYIPREMWGVAWLSGLEEFRFDPATVVTRGHVVVVGNHDGTRVRVYTLPYGRLVEDTVLNKLQKVTVTLPNGTLFKVSASQPATVILMAGRGMERGEADASIFFTAVDGRYVGKEFVFIAVQGKTGLPFRVYALEDSDVTITDVNGTKVQEFRVPANGYKELSFESLQTYRLTSTGNVILKSGALGTCFYPAVEGGFVGKLFYGSSGPDEEWPEWAPPHFVMTGLTASKIEIVDLGFKREYGEADLAAGSNVSRQLKLSHMVVQSEQPIVLLMESSGVGFLGLRAGQEAYVDIPTDEPYPGEVPHISQVGSKGEAYLFAYKETTVTIDDVRIRLSPDQVEPLTPGFHRISATENILIQLTNWPAQVYSPLTHSETRLANLAACIPSIQAVSLANTGLNLKPVVASELPWVYIVVASIVVVLVALMLLRRRKKP